MHVSAVQVRRGKASFDVALTTYELLNAEEDCRRLAAAGWEYVVVDEAHRLKNAKSKLRSQLLRLRFSHLLLLTGGPQRKVCTMTASW